MRIESNIGTSTQDRFSKNAYLVGVVYCNPIFCEMAASALNSPVIPAILKWSLSSFFKCGRQMNSNETAETKAIVAEQMAAEYPPYKYTLIGGLAPHTNTTKIIAA